MKKLNVILCLLALAFSIVGLLSSPSQADMTSNARYEELLVTSLNPNDFSGVQGTVRIKQYWSGTTNEWFNESFDAFPNALEGTWVGDANVEVSNQPYDSSTGTMSAIITMTNTVTKDNPGITTLERSLSGLVLPVTTLNGYYTTEILWSGWAGVYVAGGGPFTIVASFPGDWSGIGPGEMNHDPVVINPLWDIDQNFVYNGTDKTYFQAHMDQYIPFQDSFGNYGPGPNDAHLSVRLYGAPVPLVSTPEPTTMLLLGLGLIGLAGVRRKLHK